MCTSLQDICDHRAGQCSPYPSGSVKIIQDVYVEQCSCFAEVLGEEDDEENEEEDDE